MPEHAIYVWTAYAVWGVLIGGYVVWLYLWGKSLTRTHHGLNKSAATSSLNDEPLSKSSGRAPLQ